VLNALVHRQNREIPGAAEPPGVVERLHISQDRRRTVVIDHHAVNVVMTRQIQLVGWNGHTTML
jgi:hypothetical protein